MFSSNVQPIDHLMDYMAQQFWTMRQSNGCSTPTLRSSVAKQWIERTCSNDEEESQIQHFQCSAQLLTYHLFITYMYCVLVDFHVSNNTSVQTGPDLGKGIVGTSPGPS